MRRWVVGIIAGVAAVVATSGAASASDLVDACYQWADFQSAPALAACQALTDEPPLAAYQGPCEQQAFYEKAQFTGACVLGMREIDGVKP